MEKSQWDLKKIRFKGRRLTRLDDFITTYKDTHTALLREFSDAERLTKRKVKQSHYVVFKCLLVNVILLRKKKTQSTDT